MKAFDQNEDSNINNNTNINRRFILYIIYVCIYIYIHKKMLTESVKMHTKYYRTKIPWNAYSWKMFLEDVLWFAHP